MLENVEAVLVSGQDLKPGASGFKFSSLQVQIPSSYSESSL